MNLKSIMRIFSLCCACISFYIGAGFSTMQEIMQYEASYGTKLIVVIIVAASIYIYTNISFATNGNRLKIQRGGEIYAVYCSALGKKIGKYVSAFFDYFAALLCYMCFVVMCGGASSTFAQQWNFPVWIGAVILSTLSIITVVFGLDRIVKTLSKAGPSIVVMILIVSIVSSINGYTNFATNIERINDGEFLTLIKQVGNGNPFASGASYGGFVILWFASFLSEIGSKNNLREVNIAMIISSVFIFGTSVLCCIALISNVDLIALADIPALVLAYNISPILSQLFAIIICVGIFTSAVPLLWTGVRKIAQEGTKKYTTITIIGGIVGCIIALLFPYKGLINVLYGLNGYLGFVMIFIMIFYDVKTHMSRKR